MEKTVEQKQFASYVFSLLPYRVIVQNDMIDGGYRCRVNEIQLGIFLDLMRIDNTKVYLRPMSDITDEEIERLRHLDSGLIFKRDLLNNEIVSVGYRPEAIDYLNSRFLDYRDYISQGRAIATTIEDLKLK